MSWLSDRYADFVSTVGKAGKAVSNYSPAGLIANAIGHGENDVSKFFQNEFIDKKDLRGAEIETMMSGLPIVGGIVRGVDGINQLEDLYNRTGKVPAYPGASGVGGAGIGSGIGKLARKIENGTNDLSEYYSGEKLGPLPVHGEDYVTGDEYVNQ